MDSQVIVMLNVLIAVVSDLYDYAMTRASGLFLRTRLVLVAELDALGLTEEVHVGDGGGIKAHQNIQ